MQKDKDVLKKIKAFDLRINCHCALCIEEFSGRSLLDVS